MNDFKMTDYVTYQDFLLYPTSLEDTEKEILGKNKIEALIELVGYWVKDYVGLPLIRQRITETIHGNSKDRLFLEFMPETLITVREVADADSTTLLPYSEFRVNKDLFTIHRTNHFFSSCYSYEITYESGDITFPDKVKHAVLLGVEDFINRRDYKEYEKHQSRCYSDPI